MEIPPIGAMGAAAEGMRRSDERLADDAARIAREPFVLDAHVDISVQVAAYAANAAVLRSAARTRGTLLDALA